jgi:hypothetical protein
MDAIHRRFSDVTLKLFDRHGMRTVDFWEDAEGHDRIYYLLEHGDREAREESFRAFREDPEWIRAKEQSEADGPIVESVEPSFMKRVPHSPAGR